MQLAQNDRLMLVGAGADVTYFQAAANTRVVGATVALLIRILTTEFGEDLAKIHIIGHR
jgi:hypothetical protein